jgi:hypothetical protein
MLTKLSTRLHSWARGWLILALFAVFVIYVALTLPALQKAPGGSIVSLDAQLYYPPNQAYATIADYGEASRFWILIYLTWDVGNPLLYVSIFSLLLSWLLQRSFKPASKLQRLNLLPLGAGVFDLLENLSIVTMLAAYPTRLNPIAWLSTACTLGKMSLLGLSLLLIIFGLLKAALNGFRKQ